VDIEHIQKMVRKGYVIATDHFRKRRGERKFSMIQVKQAIYEGRIIEERPKQKPYPECLIMGEVDKYVSDLNISFKTPLFVMCGVGNDIYLITADWNVPREWGQKVRPRR
jgi:hypothetical protein